MVGMAVSVNSQGLIGLIWLGLQAAERGTGAVGARPCPRLRRRPDVWEDVTPPPLMTARSKLVGSGPYPPVRLAGPSGISVVGEAVRPPLVGDAVVTCSHGLSPGRRCPTLLQRCRPGRWVGMFALPPARSPEDVWPRATDPLGAADGERPKPWSLAVTWRRRSLWMTGRWPPLS